VMGKVDLVKSIRHGHPTGVIGVKFTHIQLPGAAEQSIEGVLTSWRQDDRKRLVELAPLVSTGRTIETVFIGQSSAGRASTLVGDDLANGYSDSGLGDAEATVTAGTQITMEFTEPLTEPRAAKRTAANASVRHIHAATTSVVAAQHSLTEQNYYHGEADGALGPASGATRQAIIRFQLDHQQPPTGDLDEETLRVLGVKLPAQQ
jgi:putative peptidoglycan binding protein